MSTYRTRAYQTDRMGRLVKWREGQLAAGNPAIPVTDADPTDNPSARTDGEDWTLDALANWTSKSSGATPSTSATFTPNGLNQYTSVDPDGNGTAPAKVFSFDFLGNARDDEQNNRKYVWDLFGRLTKVVNRTTGSEIAVYRYDALNRRVEKQDKTSVAARDGKTRYLYDGWRAIEERAVVTDGGTEHELVRARYGFGNGLDEVVWMDRDVARTGGADGGTPDAIAGTPNGTIEARYYVAQDALGSVAAATENRTDPQQALVVAERFTYTAYGEVSAWTGAWDAANSRYGTSADPAQAQARIQLPYLYTGQRLDAETGLYYYKNRYYDPARGRFLRRDLLGYGDGPNVYQYAASNPAVSTDSLGLYCANCRDVDTRGDFKDPLAGARSSGAFRKELASNKVNSAVTGIGAHYRDEQQYRERLEFLLASGRRLSDNELRDLAKMSGDEFSFNWSRYALKGTKKQTSEVRPIPGGGDEMIFTEYTEWELAPVVGGTPTGRTAVVCGVESGIRCGETTIDKAWRNWLHVLDDQAYRLLTKTPFTIDGATYRSALAASTATSFEFGVASTSWGPFWAKGSTTDIVWPVQLRKQDTDPPTAEFLAHVHASGVPEFSRLDIDAGRGTGAPVYLLTPDHQFVRFDPVSNTITDLTGR